jgi:hypothetical protein
MGAHLGQVTDSLGANKTAERNAGRHTVRTFTLRSGHTVTTQNAGTGRVEFITANAAGEVISSVTHSFAESVPLLRNLGGRCVR